MDFTKDGIEARRKQIDARIAALEREILDLKTERNSISPTAFLPVEILEQIFVAFRNLYPHPPVTTLSYATVAASNGRPVERTVMWSVVAEVSQHWRSVSLGYAQLWSHITFHKPGWAKLMLERSKQAPLYIQ